MPTVILQVLFKKKKKLNKLQTKSTSIIIFVYDEGKLDYKIHLSISFCELLSLMQIYFSISCLLFTLTLKLSMVGITSFLLQLHKYIFPVGSNNDIFTGSFLTCR